MKTVSAFGRHPSKKVDSEGSKNKNGKQVTECPGPALPGRGT